MARIKETQAQAKLSAFWIFTIYMMFVNKVILVAVQCGQIWHAFNSGARLTLVTSGDGGREKAGGEQSRVQHTSRDGTKVQTGEREVQRGANGGDEEDGSTAQTTSFPDQEEAVGE